MTMSTHTRPAPMLKTPPPPPLRAQKTLPIIITNNVSPKTGFQFKGVNPLWSGHTRKRCNSLVAVIHKQESRHNVPKSVLRAVLGRMQFTLHATRRTPHGASCLVQAMSAWLVKTRLAPSRHSTRRNARVYSMVVRPRHAQTEYPPHHTPSLRIPYTGRWTATSTRTSERSTA